MSVWLLRSALFYRALKRPAASLKVVGTQEKHPVFSILHSGLATKALGVTVCHLAGQITSCLFLGSYK
jgi:hypothetical protein